MHSKRQSGSLSLVWCAVLIGVVTLVAMTALLSMRYERNMFAEAWAGIKHTVQHQVQENAIKPASAEIRKCIMDGKATYTNVACGVENATVRRVDVRDTRGFEPPKAPPSVAPETDAPPVLTDKRIEQAMQR